MLSFGTVCLALPSKSFILVLISLFLFGFSIIPILGIGYTFAGMNFLPISPAASCGIVHIANSLVTFILNAFISLVIDEHIWGAIYLLGGSILIANVIGYFVKETIPKDLAKDIRVRSLMSVVFTYNEHPQT